MLNERLIDRVDVGMGDRHAATRARRDIDDRLAAGVAQAAIESGELDEPEVLDAVVPGLYADLGMCDMAG
jgi:hypothetical protein